MADERKPEFGPSKLRGAWRPWRKLNLVAGVVSGYLTTGHRYGNGHLGEENPRPKPEADTPIVVGVKGPAHPRSR